MRSFFELNLNLASPYAAGIDNTVDIIIEENAIKKLFLKPFIVADDSENWLWKASSVRFLGHSGVGTWKIST